MGDIPEKQGASSPTAAAAQSMPNSWNPDTFRLPHPAAFGESCIRDHWLPLFLVSPPPAEVCGTSFASPPVLAVHDAPLAASHTSQWGDNSKETPCHDEADTPVPDRSGLVAPWSRASVTVVVPTKNAARTLRACLESIVRQSVRCGLVVVDCGSVDDSENIASGFADLVLNAAPNPSLQRNIGARALPADIIGFVDADMVVGEHVVEQAIEQIVAGAGSVVVPEHSLAGLGDVRAFERSTYLGILESSRFFSYDLFEALGGFDKNCSRSRSTDLGRAPAPGQESAGPRIFSLRRGRVDLSRGLPEESRVRGVDCRIPPQARKPCVGGSSQAPILRAPLVAPGSADSQGEHPSVEGRRSSGHRRPCSFLDMAWKPERRVTADPARIK